MKMNIKKDDNVVVLSGKSKGKRGRVLSAFPKNGTVIVEGAMVATKHKKPRRQGEPGGIIHQETPLRACKVMLVCNKCSKPTRTAHMEVEGKMQRICKHCGETV